MFLSPDFYNTVQIEAYDLFNSNPTQYEKLAKESAERDAKNKIEDSIGSTEFNDDVQEDFKIAFNKEEKIQIYMGAKKLKEANMVLASSGILLKWWRILPEDILALSFGSDFQYEGRPVF